MRLAVFASGGGTNFQAILDAISRGDLSISIALCLSNKEDAGVLDRARSNDIPTTVYTRSAFRSEEESTDALLQLLREHGVDLIALAGYMRKVPSRVVKAYEGRILNIHPALLPAFGGKGMYGHRVHEAVIASGVRWTGATVHIVDEEYDTGPIVLQEPVPVYSSDTPKTVAERVLKVEHRLYPKAIQLFAENRVTLDGRRVLIREHDVPPTS